MSYRRFSGESLALLTRQLAHKLDSSRGNPGLIETVDKFLAENGEKLWDKMGFSSNERPNRLFAVLQNPQLVRCKLLRQRYVRNIVSSTAHVTFLRTLYPLNRHTTIDLGQRNPWQTNYDEVNHQELALAYENLPKPRPFQMNSEDLERLLEHFTNFRNFIRPNLISKNANFGKLALVGVIIKKVNQMFETRRSYLNTLAMIVDDLKESGIPLTDEEKMLLIKLTFFRDHEGIMKKINRRLAELDSKSGKERFDRILARERHKFTEESYDQIVHQFESPSVAILNDFLRLATSWNNEDLIKKVLEDIKTPDYTTYRHLLFHYSLVLNLEMFFHYLSDYLQSQEVADTKIVNVIQMGLMKFGYEHYGLQIIEHMLTPNEDVYRQQSAKDRAKYNEYLLVYMNISKLMPISSFAVSADAATYKTIIDTYCLKRWYGTEEGAVPLTFSGLLKVVKAMESGGILLNTQMYGAIFGRFLQPRTSAVLGPLSADDWDLTALNYMVGKLISAHDSVYTISDDSNVRRNLHQLQLAPELEHFMNRLLPGGPLVTGQPQASSLKLSAHLVSSITSAFFQFPLAPAQSKEIIAMKTQLDYDIEALRAKQSSLRSAQLDSIYYCRKTYLLRLLECTLV